MKARPSKLDRAGDPAADGDAVQLRKQEQAPFLVTRDKLRGGHRLVRHNGALERRPRLEVGGRLGDAQRRHPDLFSLPCFFA
jgi:hypothetical protein